ncbi:MAG: ABC transporter substrate-binding protein [Actinomycetes bacterium]
MGRLGSFFSIAPAALLCCSLLGLTACSEDRSSSAEQGSETTAVLTDLCNTPDLVACAAASSISAQVPAKVTKAVGEPLVLGMINQENTPVGSFPELSQGVQAAIDFVNAQLGGVDGRPVQLEVCNTKFSAEGSTSCAQQFATEGVPAVLGGIDVFGNGIDLLAENKIPFIGGIPVSTQSMTAPNSFQFSGGSWGAMVAFADYAATQLKAKSVAILYGDFGSVADGANYGKQTLEKLGVQQVQMVPYPILETDLSSAIQAAAAGNPDAIILLTADTGCTTAFEGMATIGLKAQAFYTGACAAPKIIEGVPAADSEHAIFNVEGPISRTNPDPDTNLYNAVIAQYGNGLDAIGAATVTFRAFMNLYVVLSELGADGISADAVTMALRGKVDASSFMGHPYTCNGKQFKGLPAACAPQQMLGEMTDRQLNQVGSWVDVGKIYGMG